jgi:hypothetical protein
MMLVILLQIALLISLSSVVNGADSTSLRGGSFLDPKSTQEKTSSEDCEPGVLYRAAGFPLVDAKVNFGNSLEAAGFDRGVEVGVQDVSRSISYQSGNLVSTWPW